MKVRLRQATECCVWSLPWPSLWVSYLTSQRRFLPLQNWQNASYTDTGWTGTNWMRIYMNTLCMLLNAIKCVLDPSGVFIQLTVTHVPERCLPCPRMTPLSQLYLLFSITVLTYPQVTGPGLNIWFWMGQSDSPSWQFRIQAKLPNLTWSVEHKCKLWISGLVTFCVWGHGNAKETRRGKLKWEGEREEDTSGSCTVLGSSSWGLTACYLGFWEALPFPINKICLFP